MHCTFGVREQQLRQVYIDIDVLRHRQKKVKPSLLCAQRRLGSMLYWGQHGISKDPGGAMKWFERSAMQMKDPSALYDYSILLMKVL